MDPIGSRFKAAPPCRFSRTFLERLCLVNFRIAQAQFPLVAAILGLLFTYYPLEWNSGGAYPSGWGGFVPTSLAHGLVMAAIAAGLGILAFRAASVWPITANVSVLLAALTTTYLSWATRLCDPASGVAAGAAVVCVVITSRIAVAQLAPGRLLSASDQLADRLQSVPVNFPALVFAFRILVSIFMGFLVVVAVGFDGVPPEVRPLLFVFAGVGLTSAASLKAELTLRNLMAFAGMVVSVVGSYMQMDRVVDVDDILAAVGVIGFVLFALIAFRTHRIVPVLTVPFLAAWVAMSLIALMGMVPVIFISPGCGISDKTLLTSSSLLGIVAISYGIATWCIVTVIVLVGRKRDQAQDASTSTGSGTGQ